MTDHEKSHTGSAPKGERSEQAAASQPTTSQPTTPQPSASSSSKLMPAPNLPKGRARSAMIATLFAINVNASFMQSSMNVALDKISTDFTISLSEANWVVLGYAIIVGTVITMAASLLKRYGMRKIMMTSLVFAFAGSLLGAVAWNFPILVAARLIQAVATGLAFPVVSDALLTLAPNGKAGLLLSLNSGVIGLGLAFAPSISGLIITYLGLKELFALSVIFSAAIFAVSFFTIHDLYDRQTKRVDAISVALSLVALGTFMYGLNEVTHQVVPSLILMAVAIVVTALFVIRQKRLADPLLNLQPLKVRQFTFGEILMMLGYVGSLYLSLLAPLFLEGADGRTPFIAGVMLALPIVCYAVFCFVSGFVVARRGVWPLVPAGFALAILGFGAMFFASSADQTIPFLICVGASYAGIGLLFPAIKSADLEVLPKRLASNGSSIHSTLVQIAGSISSALFVGIMSSDVSSLMASGASKAVAYSAGFSHTLLIAIGVLAAAFIASFVYAKAIVKVLGNKA